MDSFYRQFLGRTELAAERLYWIEQLQAGEDENTVVLAFLSSPEYTLYHASNDDFVNSLYVNLLGRTAEPAGLSSWSALLAAGVSREAVAAAILNSDEAILRGIDSYYFAALHRPADDAGRQNWLQQAQAGLPLSSIAQDFLTSSEYMQDALLSQQGT